MSEKIFYLSPGARCPGLGQAAVLVHSPRNNQLKLWLMSIWRQFVIPMSGTICISHTPHWHTYKIQIFSQPTTSPRPAQGDTLLITCRHHRRSSISRTFDIQHSMYSDENLFFVGCKLQGDLNSLHNLTAFTMFLSRFLFHVTIAKDCSKDRGWCAWKQGPPLVCCVLAAPVLRQRYCCWWLQQLLENPTIETIIGIVNISTTDWLLTPRLL